MPIIVEEEPTVQVTPSELARYRGEYERTYMYYSGTPPTLAEYIARRQQRAEQKGQNHD